MLRIIRTAVFLFLAALLCLPSPLSAPAEGPEFTVSLPESVKGYTPCEITVVSPAAGEAELRLYDRLNNLWLVRQETLSTGENSLSWDGLGTNRERLMAGPYHFDVTLRTDTGAVYSASASFQINATTPTLVYALPSSETLYLDHGERWFVEVYVSVECLITMEVLDASGTVLYTRELNVSEPDGTVIRWAGALTPQRQIAPGEYTVRCRSKLNPEYVFTFPLEVRETSPATPEIGPTGPVIPERGMSDEEIWEIMMKPSVVIAGNGASLRFDLYKEPRYGAAVGSLRCATQGLEILDLEGEWAHVRAWTHTDGSEVTGYIRLERLTVVSPGRHYGVLIDEREQTLTVYRDGHPIGTVPVSTGLAVRGSAYRETPAGAFLTDMHMGASFAQEGYRYEYPLRYDAGNIIHSVGYVRRGGVRDYSHNLPLLGQKASHGCVRVSPFLTGDSPINMYWLWTHLPWHTRVIILDD